MRCVMCSVDATSDNGLAALDASMAMAMRGCAGIQKTRTLTRGTPNEHRERGIRTQHRTSRELENSKEIDGGTQNEKKEKRRRDNKRAGKKGHRTFREPNNRMKYWGQFSIGTSMHMAARAPRGPAGARARHSNCNPAFSGHYRCHSLSHSCSNCKLGRRKDALSRRLASTTTGTHLL